MSLLLQSLTFMLPAYVANMTPMLIRKVNLLDFPLDFGKTWMGQRILGSNKTFRGFVFGTLAAIGMAGLQRLVSLGSTSWLAHPFNLSYSNWFWIGFLLGFGALFGDAVESFFKRRIGLKPGTRFLPWDQLDYSIGALAFVSLVFVPPITAIVIILIASFFLHIASVHLAFFLGIRKERW